MMSSLTRTKWKGKILHEQDKDGEWNASTNRSGKMAFILIYRNHVQKSICANTRENMERWRKVKNHIDKPANLITFVSSLWMYFGCSVLPLNGIVAIQMLHTQGYTPPHTWSTHSKAAIAAHKSLFKYQATPTILPTPYRHFTIIISVILQQNNSFFRLLRCVVFQHICTVANWGEKTRQPNQTRTDDEKAGNSRKFNIISQ